MTKQLGTQLIHDFLSTMENRDLAKAKGFLAEGFTMIFPGGNNFTTLEQLIDWSRDRYNWVKKHYERFDEVPAEEGQIVYCYGMLYGEWLDGTNFDNIRFIDRFTVRDGKLIDQRVWNDMGEVTSGAVVGGGGSDE